MRRRPIALALVVLALATPALAADEPAPPPAAVEPAPATPKKGHAVWIALAATLLAVASAMTANWAARTAKSNRAGEDQLA